VSDFVCALDTSTSLASIAFARGEEIIAEVEQELERAHGERLVPLLDELTRAHGIEPEAVRRWIVGIGPGSFTGVRIAVATVKGIALATDAEVVGVTSFDAVTSGVAKEANERIVAVLDAMKGELYVRVEGAEPFFARADIAAERVRALLGAGEAPLLVGGCASFLPLEGRRLDGAPHDVPHARSLLSVGRASASVPLALLEPEYVRPADVTKPG
jgi:tRNA threonylcarbamoyladenosine biosynthesis protein TsaB